MKKDTELTEKEWKFIKRLLPRQRYGRPRANDLKTLNGILFVLKTGCRWRDIPCEYGAPATCHRRLIRWQQSGVWTRVLRILLGQLHKRGRLKLSHGILDGSFAPAKKGAIVSAEHGVG